MSFKRMEGFSGSIPQKFIDTRVPKCPMCGTTNPHWSLDQIFGMVNRYLFKCEQCECILSATMPDVTGVSRTPLSTFGLLKMASGKKVSTIYMKIDHVGKMQTTNFHQGKEISLEEINDMANQI